jgi:putative solute:sodium symporter small subunit
LLAPARAPAHPMGSSMTTLQDLQRHWRRSQGLTASLLAVWFVVSFAVPFFARSLDTINFLGWPLPFYMAAQGSLVIYVAIIGIYAYKMRQIDRDSNVDEEEESE